MNNFYDYEELPLLGLKSFGKNVKISRKASIYQAGKISLGDDVRIDDFCVISGNVSLGSFIHIATHSALFGGVAGIVLEDFTTISSRCAVYALSDDYSGYAMTNPTVPDKYRNVIDGQVKIERHVIIGTGTTILPAVLIGEGAAVGAMSLVKESLEPWGIYVGIPCKMIRDRKRDLLNLETEFLKEVSNAGE